MVVTRWVTTLYLDPQLTEYNNVIHEETVFTLLSSYGSCGSTWIQGQLRSTCRNNTDTTTQNDRNV